MTITRFVSEVSAKMGFARSNRFSIEIPRARNSNTMNTEAINLMCESVSLPGSQILTTDYSTIRHTAKYPTGVAYDDVELSFALTSDYYARKFFDEWIAAVITTTNDTYKLNYRSDYARDVIINQLNENDEKIYSHKLLDAYPTTIQNIDLSNTNDDDISRFSVTLTYDKYEITNHK